MPDPDKNLPIPFPLYGLDVSVPYSKQPDQTTPEGVNVRGTDPELQRSRGGSRSGLSKFIPAIAGSVNLVQCLDVVVSVDPDGDALLDNYDDPLSDAVGDPSNGGRGRGRLVRYGGSGRRPWKLRKRTPIVSWSDPSDISQGTALDGTQLNATAAEPSDFYVGGASVSGTFVYTPPSGTVLGEGNGQVLEVQFTPDDNLTWRTPPKKKVHINVTSGPVTYTYTGIVLGTGSTAFDYNTQVTAHPSDSSGDTVFTVELNTVPPFTALTTAPVGAHAYTLDAVDNTDPEPPAANLSFDSGSPNQPWPGVF